MIFKATNLPSRKVRLEDGKEYLWFSGTDYLGMGQHELYKEYIKEGFDQFGTHFGSSRNNSLQIDIYEETELLLAKTVGAEAALFVSSGFWAGQLIHKALYKIVENSAGSEISLQFHYAPGAHPAIWGENYLGSALDWGSWAKATIQSIVSSPEKAHIICSDAVGSPWAEKFDFSIFENLPETGNIWLIVDDSHGMGVIGNDGFGTHATLSKVKKAHTIIVSSLNKAMGIPAGVIFATQDIYDILRRSPWFSGASPSAPAYIFAFRKLIMEQQYGKALHLLQENIAYFQSIAIPDMFSGIEDYPVLCSRNTRLFDFLFQNGILASCFSYPLPTDAPVCRIAISSVHQKKDLDKLAEVCMRFH